MNYAILAEFVVILHFLFVLFALFGALFSFRWKKLLWIQIPAAIWAMAVEFGNIACPLTPLEKWLIERQGMTAYKESFVEHHILSLLYPGELGANARIALGLVVLFCNLSAYALLFRRTLKKHLE